MVELNKRLIGILREYNEGLKNIESTSYKPDGDQERHHPFFSSVQAKKRINKSLDIRNGGTIRRASGDPKISCRVEIRIGDYEKGGAVEYSSGSLPIDFKKRATLMQLSDMANEAFWDCAKEYAYKFRESLGRNDASEIYTYFSRENPSVYHERRPVNKFNMEEIEDTLKKVTSKMLISKGRPKILESWADFNVSEEARLLMNSEDAEILTYYQRYDLYLGMTACDEGVLKSKNVVIPHIIGFHGIELNEIPDYEKLMETAETMREELYEIVHAPIPTNGTYPAIKDTQNHGVLWHEAIGHALEGHRMKKEEYEDEVNLFKDKIGEPICPDFISVYDDPTLKDLDGHYLFDEEGIRGKKVTLVKDGILKNYLHSRSSAGYFKTKSNGHARAENCEKPVARMSNLVIKSSYEVPYEELKDMLVREIYERGKKYGLIFINTTGGITLPDKCHFETYPQNVFTVDRKGREKRVKGIYLVGTPLQMLENIKVTSDRYGIFNGSCLAESGRIPATETAPDALISLLEVNRIPIKSYPTVLKPVYKY